MCGLALFNDLSLYVRLKFYSRELNKMEIHREYWAINHIHDSTFIDNSTAIKKTFFYCSWGSTPVTELRIYCFKRSIIIYK